MRARKECAPRHGPLRGQLKGEWRGSSPMGLRAQPARGADATTRASDHPRHAHWVAASRPGVKSRRHVSPRTRWTSTRKSAQIASAMNARDRAAWKKKLEGMRQEALGKGPVRIEPNR